VPLYFAYGANLDKAAMAQRCPGSRPLGPARLMNHRFFIMSEGFASVRRAPGSAVHGLLWDLALADIPALDRFEEVGRGLYRKLVQPVVKPAGTARALVYIGQSLDEGPPRPGYLEAVIAAARSVPLPDPYLRSLTALLGTRAPRDGDTGPAGPVAGVRPRFATPFDRG
jgi:gamma-glutamylcyclotransferase (GGCT)/AIG2-like uncharacterized protein YtfP